MAYNSTRVESSPTNCIAEKGNLATSTTKGDGVITISIINDSTVITDAQLAPAITALQVQVSQHFAPIWGVDAKLVTVPKGQKPDPRSWWLIIANTSDFAGTAGYHDTTPEGMPLGKAFIKDDVEKKRPWSVTLSHEVLEMLADPDISICVESATTPKVMFYSREVCDPCQDDRYAYSIVVGPGSSGRIMVSDFVYPGYYHEYRNYKFFDHAKHITKPLQVLKGGYLSVYDPMSGRGWRDVDDNGRPPSAPKARARVGSRRERRMRPRVQWQRSEKGT